jgi:hypothetical protein
LFKLATGEGRAQEIISEHPAGTDVNPEEISARERLLLLYHPKKNDNLGKVV